MTRAPERDDNWFVGKKVAATIFCGRVGLAGMGRADRSFEAGCRVPSATRIAI
jgi:hypothetical protein